MATYALLKWQVEMGADEAIGNESRNYFAAPSLRATGEAIQPVHEKELDRHGSSSLAMTKLQASPALAAGSAREMADKAATLAELEAAVRAFDGCALKKTASKTVFADGNPNAAVMVIGEAPGAQEDMQGIPFCGPSGALLDKMLAAIGLSRAEQVYISNTVFWRPPGNRQPSVEETAICLPFVEKHIALIQPKLLLLAGGTAASSLLSRTESISRLRGKAYPYQNAYLTQPIQTIITYHPSYLLRQPAQKRLAWQDMLMIQSLI
ncbi:MAG: uracil-DNA glycosylase [Alphaproteobacteria bacterium]|nr:uracil-DNA glycosylase [Alphaproteobacteria bacterium]